MKKREFTICQVPWVGKEPKCFDDFKIGNIVLSRHIDTKHIGVLSIDHKYARQLLLLDKSDFDSGRVPIYVCSCCYDLGCGAVTVKVDISYGGVVWSDFGYQGVGEVEYSQSGFLSGTGPYCFDFEQYKLALYPYIKSLRG